MQLAPAVLWRAEAEQFVSALQAEEQQLALDARRAKEARLIEFARAVEQLRARVRAMRDDTAALLRMTTSEWANYSKGVGG